MRLPLRISLKFVLYAALVGGMMHFVSPLVGAVVGMVLAAIAWAYGNTRLLAMYRWLQAERGARVPEGMGLWDDMFSLLYRQQRAQRHQIALLTDAMASFRRAAQALPDGVITLTHGFRIVWCNHTAASLFGLDPDGDAGRPVANLVRNPVFLAYMESQDWSRPILFKTANAEPRMVSVQLIEYGEGQMLLMARDVTQVERLETMRRDFVANVSHELKTPLTVLAGFMETLREHSEMPESQKEHFLRLMDEQTTRMRRIVEDLLTLSALEAGPLAARDTVVPMDPLLARVENSARSLSDGRHTIEIEVEPGIALYGHETELGSAFENLLSNAIRYTPEGGRVSMRFGIEQRGEEPVAVFSVRDTGIGIPAQHIPRLTERFYRVDRGRSREVGGTGLGLAIVKHALARHEGQLRVESEVGKGTLMAAEFPARRIARRPESPTQTPSITTA